MFDNERRKDNAMTANGQITTIQIGALLGVLLPVQRSTCLKKQAPSGAVGAWPAPGTVFGGVQDGWTSAFSFCRRDTVAVAAG